MSKADGENRWILSSRRVWPCRSRLSAPEAISSAYTPFKFDACKNVTPPEAREYGGVFHCKGYGGIDARVAEGDLRRFVSYEPNAANQTAAKQTLPQFNTTGETLEWRMANGVPFATILRLHWDADGSKGSVLVVTKLGKTDACHVAYVTATGNPDANALARNVADGQARNFDCKKDRIQTYDASGKRIN